MGDVRQMPSREKYRFSFKLQELDDVLMLGYDKQGELVVNSTPMTRAEAVMMLEQAKQWILNLT